MTTIEVRVSLLIDVVAWDIVRSNRPLIRVGTRGSEPESELHHDLHRETTAHRLTGVGSAGQDARRMADSPLARCFLTNRIKRHQRRRRK